MVYGHCKSFPFEISGSHIDSFCYSKLGSNWASDDGSYTFGRFIFADFLVWDPARRCNHGDLRISNSDKKD